MTESEKKIVIDGNEYLYSSLSDEAKAQIGNLQFVENEIIRLKAKLAVASTAKIAYQAALKNAIPATETH